MAQHTEENLIDRLDGNLSEAEAANVDAAIGNETSVASDWAYLRLAVDSIRLGAIRNRVAAVRATTKAAPEVPVVDIKTEASAVVRNMFVRNGLRIAVAVVLILGASAVYRYTLVSSTSVYNNAFSEYELSTSRGNETGDRMDAAYHARNWSDVLSAFNKQPVKTSKSYFLAGMAQMELKNFPASVQLLETVIAGNKQRKENYFEAESEYYLALAYLMNNQTAKGIDLIRKIRADIYHPYYLPASKISAADLKIVEIKK